MQPWNGKENRTMNSPVPEQPSSESSTSRLQLFTLRLWVACAIIIVAAGVANYLLNWFVAQK